MPISLSQIVADTATVTIPVGTDTLSVTYFPNKVTDETIAQLSASEAVGSDAQGALTSMNDLLCDLIKSWDFFEDDTQTTMVPLTSERLATVPLFLKGKIALGIMSDMRPE